MALMISDIQEQALEAGIRNGLGLSQVATGLGIDIKELSSFLKKNDKLMLSLKSMAGIGYQQMLAMVNESAANRNVAQWIQRKVIMKSFISSINLWGTFSEKKDLTTLKINQALKIYKVPTEVATVCSLTESQLWQMVSQDADIERYFISQGAI